MRRPTLDLPRPALLLSSGIFVLSICSFAIVPLLALYLARELHTPAPQIGVVLAVMSVANQGLQVVVGITADRFGSRLVFSLGILAVSAGYIGFALGPGFALQVLCGFSVGLGRGVLSLTGKVMLTQEAGDRRTSALTLRSVAVNAGTAVGPVIGGLLFGRFGIVLAAAVVLHAAFWLVLTRTIPSRPAGRSAGVSTGLGQLRALVRNRPLTGLTCGSVGFWYLYTQLTFTFPLYADDRFQLSGRVGLLFAVYAVVAVAFQYSVIAWFGKHTDGWRTLAVGATTTGLAFLLLAVVPSVWALLIFVVLLSVGEIIVVPTLDIVTSELSTSADLGGSFGLASLGWAAGGVLGSLVGGAGYQAAGVAHAPLYWTANGLIGLVTAGAFLALRRRFLHALDGTEARP